MFKQASMAETELMTSCHTVFSPLEYKKCGVKVLDWKLDWIRSELHGSILVIFGNVRLLHF